MLCFKTANSVCNRFTFVGYTGSNRKLGCNHEKWRLQSEFAVRKLGQNSAKKYETTGLLPGTVRVISAFKAAVSTTKSIRRLLGSQGLKRLSFQTPNVRLRQKRSISVLVLCRFDLSAANNLSNRTPHHSTHSL